MFTILLRLSTQDQMRKLHKQGSEKLNTEGSNICRAILVFSRDDFERCKQGAMKSKIPVHSVSKSFFIVNVIS